MGYTHIEIERRDGVGWVWLDRPDKLNALSPDMWEDLPQAVAELAGDDSVRAMVVASRGPAFTVGIDLEMLASLQPSGDSDAAAKQELYRTIRRLQGTMTAVADCRVPVIAAVHGYCLGAGVDLITACDIRLASEDAVFAVRETRLAIVADVGTLQRLPKIIGPGHVADLVYSGRDIDAARAEKIGLVNDVYPTAEALHEAAQSLAAEIAANSPLAVQGAKAVLQAGDALTVDQALEHVALWNSAFLHSNDMAEAIAAHLEKRPPKFTGT
ncbi:MAG TPA: crotonase/enoyl-CoA hydratase family protein [Acidimicrobiia bacterium]|jgi:enoyl-CoA hydratase